MKVKTDFGSVSSDLDPVDKASGWYTGGEQQSRFAITAGVLQRVFQRDWKTLYLYAGVGYGSRNYAKEVDGEVDGYKIHMLRLTVTVIKALKRNWALSLVLAEWLFRLGYRPTNLSKSKRI